MLKYRSVEMMGPENPSSSSIVRYIALPVRTRFRIALKDTRQRNKKTYRINRHVVLNASAKTMMRMLRSNSPRPPAVLLLLPTEPEETE